MKQLAFMKARFWIQWPLVDQGCPVREVTFCNNYLHTATHMRGKTNARLYESCPLAPSGHWLFLSCMYTSLSDKYLGIYIIAVTITSLCLFTLNEKIIKIFNIQPVKFTRRELSAGYTRSGL